MNALHCRVPECDESRDEANHVMTLQHDDYTGVYATILLQCGARDIAALGLHPVSSLFLRTAL